MTMSAIKLAGVLLLFSGRAFVSLPTTPGAAVKILKISATVEYILLV